MGKILDSIRKLFLAGTPDEGQSRLEEEIQSIIDAGEEKGLIDAQSGAMIESILEFRETLAREVMIPRTDILAIGSHTAIEEIIELINRRGHTRIPVYSGSIDNIIGILNVKDLLKFWPRPVRQEDILSILRKPYFIPETKNIHSLLHELKEKKLHMAIVIDEYGGTSGLVTLEDLIEEIVGEIQDEHDKEEEKFVDLPDGYTLVDSRVEIEDFAQRFGVEIPEGKYETLGGFILDALKRIPMTGDVIEHDGLEMVIASADERSIKRVKIRKKGEVS
ncbi:MAG TPA: hemolysin family protein [Syntrophales bacterium]|nr:hemolysin family protein [Syntrophales bacterium]HPI55940.1 hemolysin family protein [Syntrophales bacterium]HPN23569.1 hemolysin family protein [Syntrophales bacterium]HQM27906.1 hemolysin family protein [Syntrophales bacterium]